MFGRKSNVFFLKYNKDFIKIRSNGSKVTAYNYCFLFAVSLISSAILYIIGENEITLAKVISYAATIVTGLLSLLKFKTDIFHPKVYKYEIRQRQLQYWKQNHPEYEELKNKQEALKSDLEQIDDNLSELLKK